MKNERAGVTNEYWHWSLNMERIGFAASKIAKGNIILYNLSVILISFLISFFIFILSGFSILVALILLTLLTQGAVAFDSQSKWITVLRFCLMALAGVVGVLNLWAIIKNLKVK